MRHLIQKLIRLLETRSTLSRQLRVLLIVAAAPFIIMISILLFMLYSFNHEYDVTLHNASIASEFNFDFKDKLDLEMYYYVVGSRSNIDHLPLEDVEHAQNVIGRLQKTTTQKENLWRTRSMLNLCRRLSECMVEIKNTADYDSRMEQLEHNTYIITALIEAYMHDYIYDEVRELSALQQQISDRVITTVVITGVISVVLLLFMLWYSLRFTKSITRPVKELCKKVERLGAGDFTIIPVKTNNLEIETLDDGFNKMIGRINQLLEHVREDQNALHRAEMELLQAQINPHFLYNTFDSIVWLAEANQNTEVVKMTTSLSTFFRNSLSKGQDIITLEAEMQQVESYLNIQQIRYRDILDYRIRIPEELLQYTIPKLTLQPLVENALYHGVKNKRSKGTIEITGRSSGEDIYLSVTDNGAGMTPEQLKSLRAGIYQDRHTGLGLMNVHRRLRMYCGDRYGLTFKSKLDEGTTVIVRISKKNQPES